MTLSLFLPQSIESFGCKSFPNPKKILRADIGSLQTVRAMAVGQNQQPRVATLGMNGLVVGKLCCWI